MPASRFLVVSAAVFAVAAFLLVLGTARWYFGPGRRSSALAVVQIGAATVRAEVADTPSRQARGLSGHAPLAEGEGMIFLFGSAGSRTFWMKGMSFPIDIIWIRDGRVVDVTAEAPVPAKGGQLPTFSPRESADMVLEVPAGFALNHGITVGSPVSVRR